MEYRESGIRFEFPADCTVIKFDDSNYYRHFFGHLPGGKGVDFIVDSKDRLMLIEVKNCTGHEAENRGRTRTGNVERGADEAVFSASNTFDAEIPVKVAMTLACLIGAHVKSLYSENAMELEPYFQAVTSKAVCRLQKEIVVMLVLEGRFDIATRSKRMIMGAIQKSMRKKLDWLTCGKVLVVDTDTYNERYFRMNVCLS